MSLLNITQQKIVALRTREKLWLILLGFVLTYLVVKLVMSFLFNNEIGDLNQKKLQLQSQIDDIQKKTSLILGKTTLTERNKSLSNGDIVKNKALLVEEQFKQVNKNFLSQTQFNQFFLKLLGIHPGITLIALKRSPLELWDPNKDLGITIPTKMQQDIYKQIIELNFKSNYLDTLAFLDYLEKLPWRIFLDTLEYKVENYPNAGVTVKFYVLTNEKIIL